MSEVALDPPTAVDAAGVARSTMRGVGPLLLRTLVVRMVGFVCSILLARWLAPELFGLFTLCNFVVQSLHVLSDAGVAAALVQQPEEPTEQDYRAAFTFQAALAVVCILLLLACAPWIAAVYRLGGEGGWLLVALSASLVLSALGTVPSVRLDRSLQYGRRSLADLAQQLTYYALAVALAWRGWGVWSLAVGTLAGSCLSTALLWRFRPWRPGFVTALPPIRALLARGAPIQAQSLLGLADECLVPLGLGLALGPLGLGYIGWARSLSLVPHLAAWSIYGRMLLPSLSRLQSEPEHLAAYLDRAVAGIGFLVLPPLALLGGLSGWIVPTLYGSQWIPALPALHLLLGYAALVSLTTPYHSAMTAAGMAVPALRIKGLGIALMWTLAAPAGWKLGPQGYALGALAAALITAVVTVHQLRTHVPIQPFRAVAAPILASSILALGLLFLAPPVLHRFGPAPVFLLAALGYLAAVHLTVCAGWSLLDPFALVVKIARLNLPTRLAP